MIELIAQNPILAALVALVGLSIVFGGLLGLFISPWFYGLSGFVGVGLVFAGVTDTCGMGMILARMPWNTRAGSR